MYFWKMFPPMAMPRVWPRPRKKAKVATAEAMWCWGEADWSWNCRAGKRLCLLSVSEKRVGSGNER